MKLPIPALLIAIIWIGTWLANDFVFDMPRWADLTLLIGVSGTIFVYWLVAGEKK